MTTCKGLAVLTLAMVGVCAFGAGGGPVPLDVLAQQSDLVSVATLKRLTGGGGAQQQVELQLTNVLKGQASSLDLTATLPRSALAPTGVLLPNVIGQRGVWFLKAASDGYQVLPVFENPVLSREVFIAAPDASLSSPSGANIQQQLLNLKVAAYQSLPDPIQRDDFQLMSAIISSSPQDGAGAAAALMGSVSLQQHVMGLAASVRLGSPAAVSEVADELDALQSSPKFGHIIATLEGFPAVRTPEAVSAFEKLIGLHSVVPGFDHAISTGFLGIANATTAAGSPLSTRAVLPGMVALLDSKDPIAQVRAARFLGYYTLFADENGNNIGSGIKGPFATADTSQFTPQPDSTLTPAQYAGFWKVWWAQNKATLGF